MFRDYREYGTHEEVKREKSPTGTIMVDLPFDSSTIPERGHRTPVRRKDGWYVRAQGYWCEVNGYRVITEDPRVVTFRAEPRTPYN